MRLINNCSRETSAEILQISNLPFIEVIKCNILHGPKKLTCSQIQSR